MGKYNKLLRTLSKKGPAHQSVLTKKFSGHLIKELSDLGLVSTSFDMASAPPDITVSITAAGLNFLWNRRIALWTLLCAIASAVCSISVLLGEFLPPGIQFPR